MRIEREALVAALVELPQLLSDERLEEVVACAAAGAEPDSRAADGARAPAAAALGGTFRDALGVFIRRCGRWPRRCGEAAARGAARPDGGGATRV